MRAIRAQELASCVSDQAVRDSGGELIEIQIIPVTNTRQSRA